MVIRGFKCPICKKEFKKPQASLQHQKATNHFLRPFECHTCKKTFIKWQDLHNHSLSTGHPKELLAPVEEKNPLEYSCPECNKIFQTRTALFQHKTATNHMSPRERELYEEREKENAILNAKAEYKAKILQNHIHEYIWVNVREDQSFERCTICNKPRLIIEREQKK